MIGEDENIVNPNSDSTAVMIERGTKGAVIVNTKDALKTGFEKKLAYGPYINSLYVKKKKNININGHSVFRTGQNLNSSCHVIYSILNIFHTIT